MARYKESFTLPYYNMCKAYHDEFNLPIDPNYYSLIRKTLIHVCFKETFQLCINYSWGMFNEEITTIICLFVPFHLPAIL
jgi:hypothetical protein